MLPAAETASVLVSRWVGRSIRRRLRRRLIRVLAGRPIATSGRNNPKTGLPWTVAEINGTGPNSLQQFGVFSSDLLPDIQVSMVYARVDYGFDSLWSVSGNRFQGRGNATANDLQRTLTMKNSLDLSSYAPGTVKVSWTQTKSGTLENR